MTGDLKVWETAELPTPAETGVRFYRKGGWFVTKAQVLLTAVGVVLLLVVTILLTRHLAEKPPVEVDKNEKTIGSPAIAAPKWDLSDVVYPEVYELSLSPEGAVIRGVVAITLRATQPTDHICLQYSGHEVSGPVIGPFDNQASNLTIKSFEYDPASELVRIELTERLEWGKTYRLELNFTSAIGTDGMGAYRVHYKDPASAQGDAWALSTRLAPNYARRLFPCLDHPRYRSQFKLNIERHVTYTSIANMARKNITVTPGKKDKSWDGYEVTPPIPVSSLSFFLAKYEVQPVKGTDPLVSLWYPPHLANQTNGLGHAASILDLFTKFLGQALPLQRISIIVEDGLVSDPPATFGTIQMSSSLLYLEEEKSFESEAKLVYFLGRKLSDLWFGSLVSVDSWDVFWLKEGFSIYMADLAASRVVQDYDVSRFVLDVEHRALDMESYTVIEPIDLLSDVRHLSQLQFTPYKGAFLLHTISNIIKPSVFKKGIQRFIEKWKYKSVGEDELWKSFDDVQNDVEILEFVNSWKRKSYPILNVARDEETNTVVIKQSGFPLNETDGESEVARAGWVIPLTFGTSQDIDDFDHTKVRHWMRESSVSLPLGNNASWVFLNLHLSGMYRVNYTEEDWGLLSSLMEERALPNTMRSQLLNDAFSLASSALLNYTQPLHMTRYLSKEDSYLAWATALRHFQHLSYFVWDHPAWTNFQMYLESLLTEPISKLRKETQKNKSFEKMMWALLLEAACRYDLAICIEWAETSFERWKNSTEMSSNEPNPIPVEMRRVVYCSGGRLDGENVTRKFEELADRPETGAVEEIRLLEGSVCTSQEADLHRILMTSLASGNSSLSEKKIKQMWTSLSQSTSNSKIAFKFVQENWEFITERFRNSSEIMSAILKGTTYSLTTEDDLKILMSLRERLPDLEKRPLVILDHVIEKTRNNVSWRRNNLNTVLIWLNSTTTI